MAGKRCIINTATVAFLVAATIGVAFKDLHHLFAHEEEVHCEMHVGNHFHDVASEDCKVCDLQQPRLVLTVENYSICTKRFLTVKKVRKPAESACVPLQNKASRAPPVI